MKAELTDKFLAKFDSEGQRMEIWDKVLPDLYVRVSANNTKTFWLRYYDGNGDRKRKPLGEFPDDLSVSRARDLARNRKIDEDLEVKPVRPTGSKTTWGVVADTFMAKRKRDMGERTWRDWERLLDKEINPKLGKLDPEDAKTFRLAVRSVLDGLENRGVPVLRNRVFQIIRAVFNWGISKDMIEPNPTLVGIKRLPEFPRERYLSDDEIKKVLSLAVIDQAEWRIFWILLFYTAARRGAILGAKWEHFDFQEKIWRIPSALIKGKKDEVRYVIVPLSPTVMKYLQIAKEITGHTPYVVANLSTGLMQTNVQKAFIRMNKRAGIKERWTRHDVRHTISTNMGRLKVPPHVIDRIMHHRSGSTSIHHRYNQWEYIDEKREALTKWAEFLDGLRRQTSA